VFTGTVLQGNAPGDGRLQRGTLFLVRVVEVFKGLHLDQREVLVDPRTYSQYQVGAVYLFYGGQELAASEVHRDGHHGPWPVEWVEKRKLKVYAVATCGGSKEMARAGRDLRWIRWALGRNLPTRVYGTTYQIYSSTEAYVETGSNVPLEGATVRLRGRGVERSIESGADGVFEFSGIAPGEYQLWATREPWKESYRQTIEVVPGGCVQQALRLEPAGTISGVVKRADGKPAKDVRVELVRLLRDGKLPKAYSVRADTDATGRFLMERVPAGKFVLGVNLTRHATVEEPWPPSYYPGKPRLAEAQVLELAPHGKLSGVVLPLRPALPTRTVRVRVLWADGTAAEGGWVRAEPTVSTANYSFATEAQAGNVVTLRLMQHYEYQIAASWYRSGPGAQPSQPVVSEKITLPTGKQDTLLDIRLLGNRPK
jgi:hypothetical protein